MSVSVCRSRMSSLAALPSLRHRPRVMICAPLAVNRARPEAMDNQCHRNIATEP